MDSLLDSVLKLVLPEYKVPEKIKIDLISLNEAYLKSDIWKQITALMGNPEFLTENVILLPPGLIEQPKLDEIENLMKNSLSDIAVVMMSGARWTMDLTVKYVDMIRRNYAGMIVVIALPKTEETIITNEAKPSDLVIEVTLSRTQKPKRELTNEEKFRNIQVEMETTYLVRDTTGNRGRLQLAKEIIHQMGTPNDTIKQ